MNKNIKIALIMILILTIGSFMGFVASHNFFESQLNYAKHDKLFFTDIVVMPLDEHNDMKNEIQTLTQINSKQNAVAQHISMQVDDSFIPAISGRGYVLGYLPVGHNMTWYGFGCDDSLNCTSGEVDIIDADGVHMTVINGMVVDIYYG